jgi:tetratricopeptide (TPR) repeat protein
VIQQERERGDSKRALRDADAAIAAYPNSAVLLAARANVYLDKADPVKASTDLEKALKLQPDCTDAWLALGVRLAGDGDLKKAKEVFDYAITIAPTRAEAFQARAYYYDLGIADFSSAITDINQAILLSKGAEKEKMEFERLNIELKIFNYKSDMAVQLIQDINRLLKYPDLKNKQRARLLNARSIFYQKQKEYSKALADNTEAISLLSGNNKGLSMLYCKRGAILDELQAESLAARAYAEAARLDTRAYIPYHYRKLIGGTRK